MTKMKDETNVHECDWLKEMIFPPFNEMEWRMGVGSKDARLTQLGLCKAMDTVICGLTKMAIVALV
jgi:hypothetical protein